MKKRIWIAVGCLVLVVTAYFAIDSYIDNRIRHQEPWKLVADCEQDKVTRMKFGGTVTATDGRYTREDKFAILARSNNVEPGMSRKKVTKLLGQPSFVEGNTTDEGQFANCEWHYVFAGRKEDTGYFTEQQALVVAFDELGKVKSKSELKR